MEGDADLGAKGVEFYRHDLGDAEREAISEAIDAVFLAQGPRVLDFERRFGALLGVPHVVATTSCTMAMTLLLRAHGIGPGDEVITTPMSFVATANAILHVGATPVFADVDPRTGLIDLEAVEAAVGPCTRAVLCVHLYGQLCDLASLRALCDRHELLLFEDAAHAIEASRDGTRPGQLSDGAAFSFYATKNLTAGDGGAIALRDPDVDGQLRLLRNQGVTKDAATRYGQGYSHWDMELLGYKAPMTDLQAALLIPQLDRVEERRTRRQERVERYEARLADRIDVQLLERTGVSAHHLFTVLVPERHRDDLLAAFGARSIGCAVNYRAIHTLRYYVRQFGFRPDDYPAAREIGARTVSLPLWPGLPLEDVDRVADALGEILDELQLG